MNNKVLEEIIKESVHMYCGVIPISVIQSRCNISRQEAYKEVHELLKEGYLKRNILYYENLEYDFKKYPPLKGYSITKKTKETEMYKELLEIENKLLKEIFGV